MRIPKGAWASLKETVVREKTVAHFHDDMPEVYGTPFMIYLMELAAANAIKPYLPPGWISVGAGVDVKHLAATPAGFTVVARAEVVEWDGKSVTFDVEARDGVELIGQGRHVRVPVERARFDRGVSAKALKKPQRDEPQSE
ncbi:MAG TPA: thioesterase family protein [Gemmatimonadales bacterium]